MIKYTYLIPVLGVLMLLPITTFAASPNEQYVSFLQQEIAQLEAELIQLQATSTPTTSSSIQVDGVGSAIPATSTPTSGCFEWKQGYLGKYCVSAGG